MKAYVVEQQPARRFRDDHHDMGTTAGTRVQPTAQGLYVTASNASVSGF